VLEQAKTVYALDRAATVIGSYLFTVHIYYICTTSTYILYVACRRDLYMHTVSKCLETKTEYVSLLFLLYFFYFFYDEQFSEDLTLL
jgi:hypothetical protein